MLLRVFVDFVVSRHEVLVRFRLCPLSAHDEDGDIGGEAGKASSEPRDILRDVDDVTIVRILPSREAVGTRMMGVTLATSICSTCVIPSSCGVRLQGPCRCRWRRLWGSPCRRCSVCTCVFAEEQGIESQKCAASCSTGTVAQWLHMYVFVL